MKRELPDELKFITNARAPQKTTDATVDGAVCVISGATSGVGYHAARRLAAGGASIVIVARNSEKADRVASEIADEFGTEVDTILADFTDLEQVRRAARTILERRASIDLLVNSAGVHITTRTYTAAGHETVFCVNHLATFLLTRLLLPRIIESAPARIIQVNSEGHRFNGLDVTDLDWRRRRFYTGLRSYGASKTAQLLTVWELAGRLDGSGVTINAMHPGSVRTNIGENNGWLYRAWLHTVIRPTLKDPSIAAEAVYYLAAAPEVAAVSGRFFHLTIDEKPAAHALDREVGNAVWRLSEELCGLEEMT